MGEYVPSRGTGGKKKSLPLTKWPVCHCFCPGSNTGVPNSAVRVSLEQNLDACNSEVPKSVSAKGKFGHFRSSAQHAEGYV